jgi:hypothetical protein
MAFQAKPVEAAMDLIHARPEHPVRRGEVTIRHAKNLNPVRFR